MVWRGPIYSCCIQIFLLIISMGQSPSWEVDSRSTSQDIPHLLWNQQVHYHVHKNQPLVSILSQMPPVHTLPHHFPKIHSNIILPSSEQSLPFRFPDQNFVCISHVTHEYYMFRSSHPPWLYDPNITVWSVQVVKLFNKKCIRVNINSL
jgi:hypothetical protein